jgi:hypothetical protein
MRNGVHEATNEAREAGCEIGGAQPISALTTSSSSSMNRPLSLLNFGRNSARLHRRSDVKIASIETQPRTSRQSLRRMREES